MINNVPTVKIGGKKITPYAINFQNGGSSQPSTLSLKYVNKNGRYPWPDLTSKSPVTIKIDSTYTFIGYPVTSEISEDSSGSYVTVNYIDDSVILDNVFVGLRGVHGAGFGTEELSGSNYRNCIIVGEQVDPCKDLDEIHADPCAPPSSGDSAAEDNLNKKIDCSEQRLIKILDVVYTFQELLLSLPKFQIKLKNIPAEKLNYFARHTGSLREVLNAWCQEYGITFFWENGVRFVDLKKGIEINDTIINDPSKILDKTRRKSIANNYSQANINYFGLDGQIKEYASKLNGGIRLSLLPITLSDIFKDQTTGALNPFISKYYGSIDLLQECCILSKYSPKFRDLYLQYKFYRYLDEYNPDNLDMPLLGLKSLNSYVPKVDTVAKNFFTVCLNQFVKELTDENSKTFAARCFYNEESHQKFIEMEQYLANEFMGKYWIRGFNKKGYSFSAPGASVNFIPSPNASNFDFSNKIPKTVLKINRFLKKLFDLSSNSRTTDYFNGGLLLLERSSPWQPEGSEIQFISTSETLEKAHFNSVSDIVPNVVGDEWGERYSFKPIGGRQPVLKFFSRELDNFHLVPISSGSHPLEANNVNIPIDLGGFSSVYGLKSAICRAYQLTLGSNKIFIYMPVQSHDTYGNQFPGFIVSAEKSGSLDYKLIVEKIQRVIADFPVNSNDLKNSVGLRVNFRDATQYINKVLIANESTCQYDEAAIEELLRKFAAHFSFPAPVVEEKISYTIGGFPSQIITLEDGLSSLSMTLDGSGGMITQIEYGNIPKTTVSDSVRIKDFDRLTNANYNKSFFSSDNKEVI